MTIKEEEKEITKEEETKENEQEYKERIIVAPGEVVAKGMDFLPGEGTRREGIEIIAMKFGLLEKQDKLVKVIPLSGAYVPRVGNVVIGEIIDVTFNGWIVDIASPHLGFLPMTEAAVYVKKDLTEYYNFHDNIVAKIKAVKSRGIDLTMRGKGSYKKLDGGMIVQINSTRVPRIIGRGGSMINVIKEETGCSIIVGQNGAIWIRGKNVEDELLAKEAIDYIAEKPFVEGLTEKIREFLQKKKKLEKKETK